MIIARIDPIRDRRWTAFVDRHPSACIFHTTGWLEALKNTYGFEPVVYTTARPGQELEDGLVFCNISSWLTGKRTVSLPMSDHCQPLVDDPVKLEQLLTSIHDERRRTSQRFLEIRPLAVRPSVLNNLSSLRTGARFCFHTLDLSPKIDDIFNGFHRMEKAAVRRAERENVVYQAGRSQSLLDIFYDLYVPTRRRHGSPPQPFKWFSNLLASLGNNVTIRVAARDGNPVAAIMTMTSGKSVIYKYGCSDRTYSSGMPFLFWRTIQEAKASGARELDFGRSDVKNIGLIGFKDRFGANRSNLTYYRDTVDEHGTSDRPHSPLNLLKSVVHEKLMPRVPNRVFILLGELMYRHIA